MKEPSKLETLVINIGLIMVALVFAYGTLVFFTDAYTFEIVPTLILYSGLAILPPLVVFYFRHAKRAIEQRIKLELQDQIIATMRAQRHDILNELSLALAYIQLGKLAKAEQCIKFLAADLSDKYNQETLPQDAWLTIVHSKEKTAQQLGIQFEVSILAPLPTDVDEQRLLPKVVVNLLDNAFEAALAAERPWTKLEWKESGDRRWLVVKNNGPEIPESERGKVFQAGYSSKGDSSHGWGLAICQKVAKELGGHLSFYSRPGITCFVLELPGQPGTSPENSVLERCGLTACRKQISGDEQRQMAWAVFHSSK